MKKHIRKLLALLLVCMLVTSYALPAYAAEVEATYGDEIMDAKLQNSADAGYAFESRAATSLFSITASQVTSFLTSQRSGKCFAVYDYTGKTIKVTGTLYHSEATTNAIKSGLCYYDPTTDTFVSPDGAHQTTKSGGPVNISITVAKLSNAVADKGSQAQTYYAFVKNVASDGAGYVYGTLTVSVE